MISFTRKIFALLVLPGIFAVAIPAKAQIEPGLEKAVRWKWQAEPSDIRYWGFALHAVPVLPPRPLPLLPQLPGLQTSAPAPNPAGSPGTYTIKRGDALILISKRFKVPLGLLKSVNGLTSDSIRAGQVLRIPTREEVAAAAPAPTAVPKAPGAAAKPVPPSAEQAELGMLTLQVFLDREQFSPGPINAQNSPTFDKVMRLYQASHPAAEDPAALLQRAHAAVGEPLTQYALKVEDFRFIAPPQAERADAAPSPTPAGKHRKPATAVVRQAKPTYGQLTAVTMLAYRTPWEFVAERFHCDEAYLRKLNPQLESLPPAGTQFRVPNVIPFAIERALDPPLQPIADSQIPVKASILDLSLLEISRGDATVAVMPLSIARPGLRGRGLWTILNAIPRPRLVSRQELLVKPQPPTRIYGTASATPTPAPTPVPAEQILAAGPRNPVGILWINLGKPGEPDPLPYGLHGTSIPDHMGTQQSIGGLRLTNWDIARAVRLLPLDTPLEWKESKLVPGVAPVARPAM